MASVQAEDDAPSSRESEVASPLLPVTESDATAPASRRRIASLDALRGFTVMLMIFVDNAGGWLQGNVNHSPWDSLHLADIVMPFFLFMVGAAMSISLRKYSGGALARKVFSRTAKLFVIGVLTQSASIELNGRGYSQTILHAHGVTQESPNDGSYVGMVTQPSSTQLNGR